MSGPPPGPPPKPQNVPADPAEARASATALAERVEATIARASSFTEDDRNRRVDGEWSTVESLRHLVLVADLWLSKMLRGEDDPFHPIALPPTFMPPKLPGSSIDPDARPSFDEACDVLRGRVAAVVEYCDAVGREELDRLHASHAGTGAGCLGVLFTEFKAHDSFMNRDLDAIEAARSEDRGGRA